MDTKRNIQITASFTGVISTGAYENERPMFSVTESIESFQGDDKAILRRQNELQDICYASFQKRERESLIKRIEKAREDVRFYEKDGIKYPSVTSIIGWDADFFASPDEMVQYASQGNINHLKLHYFCKTGQWLPAKKIPEAHKDMVILTKGSKRLPIDSGNLPTLLEKYPIQFTASEKTVFNYEEKYAGTVDALGFINENKEWEKLGVKFGVPTLFDLKRHGDLTKNAKQMSAYAKAYEDEAIEQLIVLIVNDDTKRGFSKPTVVHDIESYYKMFLEDRKIFKERFGI